MSDVLVNNTALGQYELTVNSELVFARYKREANKLHVLHVEAPPVLRGTGAAGRMMQALVNLAVAESLELVPICGYAAAWLQRHKK